MTTFFVNDLISLTQWGKQNHPVSGKRQNEAIELFGSARRAKVCQKPVTREAPE